MLERVPTCFVTEAKIFLQPSRLGEAVLPSQAYAASRSKLQVRLMRLSNFWCLPCSKVYFSTHNYLPSATGNLFPPSLKFSTEALTSFPSHFGYVNGAANQRTISLSFDCIVSALGTNNSHRLKTRWPE